MSGGHRVHGMGTALEAPTWPAITRAEAEIVLDRFPGAGRLIDLNWHSPRPFSAATLIDTDRGAYFLKRHHQRLRTPAALAEEHGFMAHLRAAGLSVPDVMTAADGTGAIALGAWTYELHRDAPGIDLYRDRLSWTPFLTPGHACEAGAALGRLHRAAQDFASPARGDHPLIASFTILPARDPLAAANAYVAARPALARYLAAKPWRQTLARLFAALGEGLAERLAGQAPLWTHGDWHPSNLLWSAEGKVDTIFDFGLATRTCALHDLAIAIERTAFRWLDMGQDDALGDVDAALAILAGYGTIVPLDRADVDALVHLLPLVHLEFALSEIDYFAGIVGDPDQAAVAWQDYLVGHADWFLSAPGQDFSRRFAREAMA
ncbi:phosphotransferase [Sphingobium sp. 3R8]|uniref:phosphotransferase enzyme family protein n=1 Tax=Sphingobium sp. 3R8 TaxID=2874921 RepID=UPI001CCF20F8|nr:phosphotransferase [Sphingobium sp. 3R8]MBZ9647031.1 phosphotransferase [Sphingobium sp. 3R8]